MDVKHLSWRVKCDLQRNIILLGAAAGVGGGAEEDGRALVAAHIEVTGVTGTNTDLIICCGT